MFLLLLSRVAKGICDVNEDAMEEESPHLYNNVGEPITLLYYNVTVKLQ